MPSNRTSHGQGGMAHRTRAYRIWALMKDRCLNPNNSRWHRYGGRGITFESRWKRFEEFFKDMGAAPRGKSLDRIDNDGPYSKENCRWSTNLEQCNNTTKCKFVVYKGVRYSHSQLCRMLGIQRRTFARRLLKGFTVNQAIYKGTADVSQ